MHATILINLVLNNNSKSTH